MSGQEDEFLCALRATFKVEAEEHLQAIGSGLLQLETVPAPARQEQITSSVFRAAHSLKGAARAVNLSNIESLCQSLEDLFATWKRREALPTQQQIDGAQHSVDSMSRMIAELALAESMRGQPVHEAAAAGTPAAAAVQPSAGLVGETETVRIAVRSLDARLLEAEEMLAAKIASGQRVADLGVLAGGFEQWHKAWANIQPQARALRNATEPTADPVTAGLHGLAEFIEWNYDYLRSLESRVGSLRRSAEQDHLSVGKLVEDLLENSKKLAILPMATLGALLPKLVRDLCRDQGKEAELSIRGEEVKIDKRILEEMKDPLIHLLRNCVDHGIEAPELRRRSGKPPRAAITLEVSPVNGSEVEIAVSDDGAGIDVEKVKAAARGRGLIAADAAEKLPESAALALVFEADVSTSPMITEVSGRGLGLAIVREKTERLGGRVAIQSSRNAGTTIRMTLPLTLATFRGVLIEASQRLFVVPTSQVERVSRFASGDVATVEGRNTLAMNGRTVALADLAEVLQLPAAGRATASSRATPVLVLGAGEQRVAFAVDAVLDEREVLVKKFAKPLSRVRNIAGATILGSGQVALILNVPDLLRSARISAGAGGVRSADCAPATTATKKILVVEDSITSRMLLKGILESAGYDVKTAVDGIDGFTVLRAERFDVVISDVEMPRMNGLDLTARIREDRALAHIPVILVTALESREDRERGVDVGANAYLVKSSLDQSNLLNTLRQLA